MDNVTLLQHVFDMFFFTHKFFYTPQGKEWSASCVLGHKYVHIHSLHT